MEQMRDLVKKVLDEAFLMSLATVDESGPWVSDLIFIYDDDFNIYWLSQENTRHSQAILKNNQVAASITVSNNQGEDNIGLQLEGQAEKLEGDDLKLAMKHCLKRKKTPPEKEGEILDPRESWHKLTPEKIELIYEPLWGFSKQNLPDIKKGIRDKGHPFKAWPCEVYEVRRGS